MLNYFVAKNITKAKHRFPLRQIRHLPRHFRRHWPTIAIVTITTLLSFLNFEPNTYLTGWDNLHPEFDLPLNTERSINSVWQEYRGLGLLGGQAHAADLPRLVLIYILQALNIPQYSLRYLTTFFCLIIGPLGIYHLFYHHLFRDKLDTKTSQFASFFGAIFYTLNLSTLQTFFIPFETFTWFYGTLPWLLFFTISYISKPSLLRSIALITASFLSAPSFYVETIFLVFFVSILPFVIEYFSQKRHLKTSLKTITISIISIVTPHLFWLLPIIFFVFSGGGEITQYAKINQISSPQTYFRNLEFANLKDVLSLKGYLFNYLDMESNFKYDYLLSVWRSHLDTPFISLARSLISSITLIGLYYSFRKKFPWTSSFMSILGLSLFFLLGGGLLINQALPVMGELFRSPFTKFSIPLSVSLSFFFAIGTVFILDLFTFLHYRYTYHFTIFSITTLLLLYMSPAFSGNFINRNLRVNIPSEYLDLFSFMKTQNPSTRIANFPQHTFWGWIYYDWGYRGSGFLWHGLKQPLLDRAFDVWDSSSEKYYDRISSVIYSNNPTEFEKLINKYAINWILVDKHVLSPDGKTDLGLSILEKFLSSPRFSLKHSFGDQISLYEVKLDDQIDNFLSLSKAETDTKPFDSLSLRPNSNWIERQGYLSLYSSINQSVISNQPTKLHIPSFTQSENLIPTKIEYQESHGNLTLRLTPITPIVFASDKQIDLDAQPKLITIPLPTIEPGHIIELNQNFYTLVPPAELPNSPNFFPLSDSYLPANKPFTISLYSLTGSNTQLLTYSLAQANPTQCYTSKPDRKIEKIISPQGISLLGTDVNGCLSTPIPFASPSDLLAYTFTYSSPSLTSARVNISGENFISSDTSAPLEPTTIPKQTTIFTHPNSNQSQLNLILEAEDSKSIQEVTYNDIKVSTHPLLFSTEISLHPIPSQTITFDQSLDRLQVSLPLTQTQFDLSETPQSNSFLPESRNCDQFNSGNTVKQVSDTGFFYQSQNAIQCDHLNLRHFTHALNYLLSITSSNEKGLSLTTCLENYSTRRCDIFERLTGNNLAQFIAQPISNPNESAGYTLHLFNESIGQKVSTNILRSLSIHPIPLNFLKNISISKATISTSQGSTISNISSTHPTEYLYTATISPSSGDDVIHLYQSQSSYWQAIIVSADDLNLPIWKLLPRILFNYSKLEKLEQTNNGLWHNSWNLPASPTPTHLIIIYLPQYLAFAGFATIPILLITILIIFLLHKPKNDPH